MCAWGRCFLSTIDEQVSLGIQQLSLDLPLLQLELILPRLQQILPHIKEILPHIKEILLYLELLILLMLVELDIDGAANAPHFASVFGSHIETLDFQISYEWVDVTRYGGHCAASLCCNEAVVITRNNFSIFTLHIGHLPLVRKTVSAQGRQEQLCTTCMPYPLCMNPVVTGYIWQIMQNSLGPSFFVPSAFRLRLAILEALYSSMSEVIK